MGTDRFVRALGLSAWLSCFLWAQDARAYAWMLASGYSKCATCHVDPSGGETLNHMGRVQSQRTLSAQWESYAGLDPDIRPAYGLDDPDWARLGGSARVLSLLKFPRETADPEFVAFPMQLDVYPTAHFGDVTMGVSLGYADVPEASQHARAAELFRSDSGAALISRWHWVGVELWSRSLLRAGRINLPFGLRVPEHVLWVRDATKTERESDQQHGVALAGWGGNVRWEAMLVFGNLQLRPDSVRERGYSAYLEYISSPRFALGASSFVLRSKESILTGRTEPTFRQAHGPMLRWSPASGVAVLAEANLMNVSGRDWGYAGYARADYEAAPGLHLSASGELLDAGRVDGIGRLPRAGKAATGLWLTLHWFFLPHWDVQLDLVQRHAESATLQAQLHFYM